LYLASKLGSQLAQDGLDYLSDEFCPDESDDKCDPPEGTICSEFHTGGTPHKVTNYDGNKLPPQSSHVHTWQMNKTPNGCKWNKRRKQTYDYTPINAKSCSSYPSWISQRGK